VTQVLTNAAGVRWELDELARDADDARVRYQELVGWAGDLAGRYRGRIASLDPAAFAELLDELDRFEQSHSRVYFYCLSREHTRATDAETNDLVTYARDRRSDIESQLIFVDVEWVEVADDAAEALIASDELRPYRHKLERARAEKPYMLSEPEEQALNIRRPVISAFQTLHGKQLATIEVQFDAGDGPEGHTLDRLLSYAHRGDRTLRRRALNALYGGLEPRVEVLAAAYDAIVGDRLATDKLRGYEHPMAATHLANELSPEVVDTMIEAIESHYPLAQRWFRTKARLLGIDDFQLSDQYAPVGEAREFYWPEAVDIVDATFRRFSPKLADIFADCVERGHIDAEPRTGKIGGAYCGSINKEILPYVLMNYTDQLGDVMTLAHEFGHGGHFAVALERQAYQEHHSGLAIAEVPSTFAQLLAFDYLFDRESDEATRAALIADIAEGALPTVFRQTVLARFEQRAYALRAEGKALTVDRLSGIWLEENQRYYGDAVALPEGYRLGWSYIPHFIHTRFYTYAYAFAHLVTLCLYSRYRADPTGFPAQYLEFLASGGAESPAQLVARFGLDLNDGSMWEEGFRELERFLVEAEAALEPSATRLSGG
jgi:oligoendopeptidase F